MIELLIALMMALGISFGISSDEKMTMSQNDMDKLQSNSQYSDIQKDFTSNPELAIIVIPDIDPKSSN